MMGNVEYHYLFLQQAYSLVVHKVKFVSSDAFFEIPLDIYFIFQHALNLTLYMHSFVVNVCESPFNSLKSIMTFPLIQHMTVRKIIVCTLSI